MAGRKKNQDLDLGERFRSQEYKKYQKAEEEAAGGFYEKAARSMGDIARIDLRKMGLKGKAEQIEEDLQLARMNIDQEEVGSLFLIPMIIMVPLALLLSFLVTVPIALFMWSVPAFWAYWVLTYPDFRSTVVKIKSSDEALRIILYLAMYLDMNPSLEGAVKTAAEHSEGPISRDLAKILWDTQTQKYSTIKEGIGEHMKLWRKWSPEFVKSFEFLIDSVSQSESGRKRLIQKAQDNIIEATKTKMSQFARDLSGPVKVIHMAGIVLPLMGLIMFPMITVFIGGEGTSVGGGSFYLAFGYIVILPSFLFFLIKRLVAKRPGAYSAPSLKDVKGAPDGKNFEFDLFGRHWKFPVWLVAVLVALVVMVPGIIYYVKLIILIIQKDTALQLQAGTQLGSIASQGWQEFIASKYQEGNLIKDVLQGMTIFWGLCAGIVTYFLSKSYGRKKMREDIRKIEEGIDVALTELENALSKSMPAERAVYSVVEKMREIGNTDHPIHGFFSEILNRMQSMGMNFDQAIFDKKNGAILYYPSNLLENAMNVISNSLSRGSAAMAQSVRSVNEYILNHKRVEETIKELLDEVVGQMKILGRFIAPIITSVAASMSLLVVGILSRMAQGLKENFAQGASAGGQSAIGNVMGQVTLVDSINNAVPPTVNLLVISIYLLEVSLILGYFTSGIEYGFDEINMDIAIAKSVIYGAVIFTLIVIFGSTFMAPFIGSIS